MWESLRNPQFKGVMWYMEDNIHFYNYLDYPKRPIIFAKQHFSIANLVIFYPKKSFIAPTFNKQLEKLKTAGLINYWANEVQHKDFFMKKHEQNLPSSLNLSQIRGAFYLTFGSLGFSLLIFAFEVALKYFDF